MKMRHVLAGTVSTLLLTPALATAAHAVDTAPSAPAHSVVAAKGAKSPTAAVQGFAKALLAENGKAACALLTPAYANKTVKAAVKAKLVPQGSSCAKTATKLGQLLNQSGGIPKYTLKVVKQTKTTAVVKLTYKGKDLSGTYSTVKAGGGWLVSGSTVSA